MNQAGQARFARARLAGEQQGGVLGDHAAQLTHQLDRARIDDEVRRILTGRVARSRSRGARLRRCRPGADGQDVHQVAELAGLCGQGQVVGRPGAK